MNTLFLNVLASGLAISVSENSGALASIAMTTDYGFDNNVVAHVQVLNDKATAATNDPLNGLLFDITFKDKVDSEQINRLRGRLFTGGGADALEEAHGADYAYVTQKLDFYGALDNADDFFNEVVTNYDPNNADAIRAALSSITNEPGAYRTKEIVLTVPETTMPPLSAIEVKNAIKSMSQRPRYMITAKLDDLSYIESLAEIMDKYNNHIIVDVGELTEWTMVAAIAESINIKDHRLQIFWNPNLARATNAKSVLARKKWRPCVGDYIGQVLRRNAQTNTFGIPPLHNPVAGYTNPVGLRDLEIMPGVILDDEAQNGLAAAGVNVVVNETFADGNTWIFGDVMTQYDSKTSALRLSNASEIATYTANMSVGIIKKHLTKGMSRYLKDAKRDLDRALNACATTGFFTVSSELNGRYYAYTLTPRASNPFEQVDYKLSRRPEGCARQVFFDDTVTK